jgi:transposase
MGAIDVDMAPRGSEVQTMVDPEGVQQMRQLARRGWGTKRISKALHVTRNTVRRYLRGAEATKPQQRPRRRRLDEDGRAEARQLFVGAAGGNAVVVRRELATRGIEVSIRTVERVVAEQRRQMRAAEVASVRFETEPGQQMQIDFGQKWVTIGGVAARVHLLVAVLCYSRRLFVKAFLSERQDDWREGVAEAFVYFGGVVRTLLGDNARALVVAHDRSTHTVTFHPAYLAFCRDWDVEPRACSPYRARTKGKTESGVKYVKRNALAQRSFESFAALEAHLAQWMREADERVHGTTHEPPRVRFERDERAALRPLPSLPLPVREQRLRRKVALDALVDLDTVRYSVPFRLVRESVEVVVGAHEVRIFHGTAQVAQHERSFEPYARVIDPAHYEGLWRARDVASAPAPPSGGLEALGRSLDVYAAIVGEEAQS